MADFRKNREFYRLSTTYVGILHAHNEQFIFIFQNVQTDIAALQATVAACNCGGGGGNNISIL